MDILSTVDNYIDGSIFFEGLKNTLFGNTVPEDKTFLIIFDSENSKIIASTKDLSDGELNFTSSETESGGGTLTIETIQGKTKNYIADDATYRANGFALIRTNSVINEGGALFPSLSSSDSYKIYIKGALGNNPIFSKDTEFVFNSSSISFGITGLEA